VLDYLQLRFDGDPDDPQPILTCEAWPVVELPDTSIHRNGSACYTDALRNLVGSSVLFHGG